MNPKIVKTFTLQGRRPSDASIQGLKKLVRKQKKVALPRLFFSQKSVHQEINLVWRKLYKVCPQLNYLSNNIWIYLMNNRDVSIMRYVCNYVNECLEIYKIESK